MYVVGQALTMLLGFVSFPIFARAFTVSEYGIMDLVQRLVLLGTAVGKLGIQHSVIRYYREDGNNEESRRRCVSTAMVGTVISGLLMGLLLALSFLVFAPAGPQMLWFAAGVAGVLAMVRVPQSIYWNVFRVEERTVLLNVIYVGQRALTVAAIIGLFWWEKSIRAYFAGTVIVETLFLLAILAWFWRRGAVKLGAVDWGVFKGMAVFGLPLIAYEGMTILLDAGDRVMIQYFLGAEPLGFYAAAFSLCLYLHDLLTVPVQMAMVPLYLRIWAEQGAESTREFLEQALRVFVMGAFLVLAGVIVCSRDAIMIMAGAKFERSAMLIPWIAAGILVYASSAFLNSAFIIHKRTQDMAKYAAITVVVKMAVNAALLPLFGLTGAVVSTVAGYFLFIALAARASRRTMPLAIDVPGIFRSAFAMGMAALVASQIHLDSLIADLLARGTCAVVVYAIVLLSVDGEARRFGRRGWEILKGFGVSRGLLAGRAL